jgi:hypothetical protein
MTTTHTPGPWRTVGGTEVRAGVAVICDTAEHCVLRGAPRAAADARLIAAAPCLLAALQRIARAADRLPIDSPLDGIIDEARAAIARATA